MKIDVGTVLHTLSGAELQNTNGDPLTLGDVAIEALMRPTGDNLTGKQKFERGKLADRIYRAERKNKGVADVSSDEITTIKDLIGSTFAPLVVLQAWLVLEGEAQCGEDADDTPTDPDDPGGEAQA